MIEVDTLAQAIDESQCSGPVGLEDMTWSLSTASKALVDIAISLRTLAGRPLPETTPRQEAIAGKIREGVTDPEAMAAGFCQIRPDGNYVKTITRRLLSDGASDPDPSPSEGETGKREEGPKEEHMEAMRREAEQLCEQWEKTKEAA